MLSTSIVYMRVTYAIIFHVSLYRVKIIYEILTPVLYLCVAVHSLTNNPISITNLILMFAMGLVFGICIVHWTEILRS